MSYHILPPPTPLVTPKQWPNSTAFEAASDFNGFQVHVPSSKQGEFNGFHNSRESVPLLQDSATHTHSSRSARAKAAQERALRNIQQQQHGFIQSTEYGVISAPVINSQPRSSSLFIQQSVTRAQSETLEESVSRLHRLCDPCCEHISPKFIMACTSTVVGGCCGVCATIPLLISPVYLNPITGAFTGLGVAAVGISAASIAVCLTCIVRKILEKLPVNGTDLLLKRLNQSISEHDHIDLQDPRFPPQLLSTNQTTSLRDPVFIREYSNPMSAREFLQCLSTKSVLPSAKEARPEELVIDELTEIQSKKFEHLKNAFELWDLKKICELTEYISHIPEKERFW